MMDKGSIIVSTYLREPLSLNGVLRKAHDTVAQSSRTWVQTKHWQSAVEFARHILTGERVHELAKELKHDRTAATVSLARPGSPSFGRYLL